MSEPVKIIECLDCTTEHPENEPCPNCEAWARIATKARQARREWFKDKQPKQTRPTTNDP